MHRESDKHGPLEDDKIKSELQGMLKGNHPTRVEEDHDTEPPADDDPAVPPFDEHQEK